MPLDVKHQYVSTVPDNGDPTLVQGPHWNAGHNLQQGPSALLGRADSAPGQAPTLEVQLDATMAFVGGKLAAVIPAAVPPAWTDITGKPVTFPPDPEAVDDRVAALLVAGTNVTLSYNDPANTLTINSTASGGGSATLPAGSVGYGAVGNTLTGVLADFSWDATNKRLGVGIGAPAAAVDVVVQANSQAIKMSGYSLTGSNATGCFGITATLNTTGQPDIFAINVTDTSNSGGNAFVIRGGPSGTASLLRTTMSGDTRVAGWCQARLNDALATNGRDYFAYYLGNGSGGNIGLFAGLSNPTFSTFGRYGSIYLDGASPGIPYYNNNGTTGWDQLVGLTATQTLTNKTITGYLTSATAASTYAPINAPVFTGDAKAVTPTYPDNDTSIATTAYVTTALAALPTTPIDGYLFGLNLSNSSTTGVIVSVGKCANSTAASMITNGANITKLITATWAAGTAAGGRGTGVSLTASTCYYVFGGMQAGVFDAFFDTSITGANKPAAFTSFRRLGAVFTDLSNNIRGFVQINDDFYFTVVPVTISGSGPLQNNTYAQLVPPFTVPFLIYCEVYVSYSTGTLQNNFTVLPETVITGAGITSPQISTTLGASVLFGGYFRIPSTTTNIRVIFGAVPDANTNIATRTDGWQDVRGKTGGA